MVVGFKPLGELLGFNFIIERGAINRGKISNSDAELRWTVALSQKSRINKIFCGLVVDIISPAAPHPE
eukprot:COSAG02_NODE_2886_length_7814_cov_3.379123_5_plen_68_part_00